MHTNTRSHTLAFTTMAVLQSESREKSIRFPVQGARVQRRTHVSRIDPTRVFGARTFLLIIIIISPAHFAEITVRMYKTSGGMVTRRVGAGSKHSHSVVSAHRFVEVAPSVRSNTFRMREWQCYSTTQCTCNCRPRLPTSDRYKVEYAGLRRFHRPRRRVSTSVVEILFNVIKFILKNKKTRDE